MTPFRQHTGVAAPILRVNIDTDAIIPSREMKTVSKAGLADGLFAGWRYKSQGSRDPNPDFVLNHPSFAHTTILLAGENFGCGSSREHAVWALAEYGIRAIIAPSFGAIFYNNCIKNGIVPIELGETIIEPLAQQVMQNPQTNQVTIDLEARQVSAAGRENVDFQIADTHREMLLEGLDSIDITLKQMDAIEAFEEDDPRRSWAYLDA